MSWASVPSWSMGAACSIRDLSRTTRVSGVSKPGRPLKFGSEMYHLNITYIAITTGFVYLAAIQ